MNLAIVDDIERDSYTLRTLLSDYFKRKCIACHITVFSSGEDFLESSRPGSFDVVFLDIMMKGMNGMETARRLRIYDPHIPIIFVTVEESFALEGYTVQAADYILKPPKADRLELVMNRLTEQLKPVRFIEIRENRFDRRLALDDVEYVCSVGHFLEIHMNGPELLRPYMSLEHFLSQLEQLGEYGDSSRGLRFQNCCRGYVVNLEHVRSLGTKDFILNGGAIVPISRPKYKEMQAAYAAWLFARTRRGL